MRIGEPAQTSFGDFFHHQGDLSLSYAINLMLEIKTVLCQGLLPGNLSLANPPQLLN